MSKEAIYRLHTRPNGEVEEFEFMQEIVRCKECKYGQNDLFHMFCEYHYHKTYADDFCNHGKRSK